MDQTVLQYPKKCAGDRVEPQNQMYPILWSPNDTKSLFPIDFREVANNFLVNQHTEAMNTARTLVVVWSLSWLPHDWVYIGNNKPSDHCCPAVWPVSYDRDPHQSVPHIADLSHCCWYAGALTSSTSQNVCQVEARFLENCMAIDNAICCSVEATQLHTDPDNTQPNAVRWAIGESGFPIRRSDIMNCPYYDDDINLVWFSKICASR